jgi:hypothetical protein
VLASTKLSLPAVVSTILKTASIPESSAVIESVDPIQDDGPELCPVFREVDVVRG